MKKTHIAVILTAMLLLGLMVGCGKTAQTDETADTSASEETKKISTIGALTYLNFSEEEYQDFLDVRNQLVDTLKEDGYVTDNTSDTSKEKLAEKRTIKYYDSLDAMLMALNAGEIDSMEVFQSTAKYLCAQNSELMMPFEYDLAKERKGFTKAAIGSINNGFSFMMTEDKTALLESFNKAIADMQEDGTLDKLVNDYITNVTSEDAIETVQPEQIDGRDTVKVAVTGSMPPFDYVAADGTPAGFNTAVLAEIGRRLDINIELLQVDSSGRASALSSGAGDVVYWTRTASDGDMFHTMSKDEFKNFSSEKKTKFTEKQIGILNELDEVMSREKSYNMDMPESTIITDPYYIDVVVPVVKKTTIEN